MWAALESGGNQDPGELGQRLGLVQVGDQWLTREDLSNWHKQIRQSLESVKRCCHKEPRAGTFAGQGGGRRAEMKPPAIGEGTSESERRRHRVCLLSFRRARPYTLGSLSQAEKGRPDAPPAGEFVRDCFIPPSPR